MVESDPAIADGGIGTVVGSAHRSAVLDRARDLVAFAKYQGHDRGELIKIIQALG